MTGPPRAVMPRNIWSTECVRFLHVGSQAVPLTGETARSLCDVILACDGAAATLHWVLTQNFELSIGDHAIQHPLYREFSDGWLQQVVLDAWRDLERSYEIERVCISVADWIRSSFTDVVEHGDQAEVSRIILNSSRYVAGWCWIPTPDDDWLVRWPMEFERHVREEQILQRRAKWNRATTGLRAPRLVAQLSNAVERTESKSG